MLRRKTHSGLSRIETADSLFNTEHSGGMGGNLTAVMEMLFCTFGLVINSMMIPGRPRQPGRRGFMRRY